MRGGDVIRDAGSGTELGGVVHGLPYAEEADEEVGGEAEGEHLGEHEDVGGEGGLEHDGHVGGVEELDGVGAALAAEFVALYGDFDAEALEVDDDGEDEDGGYEVHEVWEAFAPEGLAESAAFVVPGEEEVEEGDYGAFEF